MDWVESAEAIGEIDELLASVGLKHGQRKTLAGTWEGGERRGKILIQQGLRPTKGGRRTGAASGQGIEPIRAPGWDRHPGHRHGFSTRAGGVSTIYSGAPGEVAGSASPWPDRSATWCR